MIVRLGWASMIRIYVESVPSAGERIAHCMPTSPFRVAVRIIGDGCVESHGGIRVSVISATSSLTKVAPAHRGSVLRDFCELAKLRLNAMVLLTTGVGYALAPTALHEDGTVSGLNWGRFGLTLLGTGLAAMGASAFNQLLEIRRDGLMERTRQRPLPAGRISPGVALVFAFVASFGGLGILNENVDSLCAGLGTLNLLVYVLLYTPLKPRTSLNTLVGAICGALPPMMGWAAAAHRLDSGAWVLGAILFLWQIPHFLGLAWLYRADYARAGFRMLPVIDPTGRITGPMVVLYCLALLPVGLAMSIVGVTGWVYAALSLLLGAGLLYLGMELAKHKTQRDARRLFLASVTYLPLLLILMLLDPLPVGVSEQRSVVAGARMRLGGDSGRTSLGLSPGATVGPGTLEAGVYYGSHP